MSQPFHRTLLTLLTWHCSTKGPKRKCQPVGNPNMNPLKAYERTQKETWLETWLEWMNLGSIWFNFRGSFLYRHHATVQSSHVAASSNQLQAFCPRKCQNTCSHGHPPFLVRPDQETGRTGQMFGTLPPNPTGRSLHPNT